MRVGQLLAICAAAATCGPTAPSDLRAAQQASVKAGRWGGQHLSMVVTADRTDIEFDCGKASVDGLIALDRDGAFSATGTFFQERPGPTTPDGPPQRPMRLSGSVKSDTMDVNVTLTDRNEDVGSFSLTFGADARLVKCR